MAEEFNKINEINKNEQNEQNEQIQKKVKKPKEENVLFEWVKAIFIAVVLALLIKVFVFEATKIEGNSMIQTLHDDDRLIINKIVMKFKPLERKDIVVMKYDDNSDYIKRIVGLPGEYIQLIDGKVYINGEIYDEPYISGDYTQAINGFEWKLGKNEYFLMGDNRNPNGSTDSRVFGPVNLDRIKGVASFRFYPFDSRFGLIK